MIELTGNYWDVSSQYKLLGVTTNGIVKNDGTLVMGKGIAKDFKKRYPRLPQLLGKNVSEHGNYPYFFSFGNKIIFSFPTKYDYREDSDIDLILKSAKKLVNWISLNSSFGHIKSDDLVLLTRPGCGNGQLLWNDVKKVLEPIFNDNIHIISNE